MLVQNQFTVEDKGPSDHVENPQPELQRFLVSLNLVISVSTSKNIYPSKSSPPHT